MLESEDISENLGRGRISLTVIRTTPQPVNISDNTQPMKVTSVAHQVYKLPGTLPSAGAAADNLLDIAQQDIRSRRYYL